MLIPTPRDPRALLDQVLVLIRQAEQREIARQAQERAAQECLEALLGRLRARHPKIREKRLRQRRSSWPW